jgi:hypothetical protein
MNKYYNGVYGGASIDWGSVATIASQQLQYIEPAKQNPIDNDKVKLDFSKLLGETKFTLNQNN